VDWLKQVRFSKIQQTKISGNQDNWQKSTKINENQPKNSKISTKIDKIR